MTLAQSTSKILRDLLIRERNHHPSPAQWQALDWIAERLAGMADGTCPQKFFLNSLDPGVGKTSCLVAFIRALLASPEHDHVGIVLFSSRLDDIYYRGDGSPDASPEDSLAKAGLVHDCFGHDLAGARERREFAVLTSDDERNKLGHHDANEARVLFTTQEHLQKRLKSLGSFAKVDSLYFRGKPRQVKAWDETILPGFPITVDLFEAYGLLAPLRRRMATSEGLVNKLKEDLDRLASWPKDTLFTMRDYEAEFGVDREDLVGCVGWKHALRGVAMSLAMLQGKTGIIRADPRDNSNSLLTYTQDLPYDLAPMMITDASGRVRQTYLEWALSNRPVILEICPPAPKDYRSLKIHHWNRGGGKGSWRRGDTPEQEARRQELLSGLEQWLNRKPTEEYLIVHHRPLTGRAGGRKGIPSLPKLLQQRGNVQGDFRRLKFLTWGNHTATNQFRDIRNIVLAGILYLPEPVYEATTRAATGITPEMDQARPQQTRAVTDGEHRHNILQAVLRCHARTARSDGGCGEAEALVIGRHNHGVTQDMLRTICPGAVVRSWSPKGQALKVPMWEKAALYVIEWCQENPGRTLRAIDLAAAMNIRPQHVNTIRERHLSFRERLEMCEIEDRRGFRLRAGSMPPAPSAGGQVQTQITRY